jgi:anti-sigma-K factor RskA
MTMAHLSDDDIALAAEVALRLLDPAALASANARMTNEPAFAAEVRAWEDRLDPLLDDKDEAPPPHIWNGISRQMSRSVTSNDNARALRLWRGIAAASTAIAATLGVVTLTRPPVPIQIAPGAPLVAALAGEPRTAALAASYDRASGSLVLTPLVLKTGTLFPELWIIPEGGAARSLGIVRRDRPMRIIVSAELRALVGSGATLAITPEPAGGAPNGKATGPVIASGKIISI